MSPTTCRTSGPTVPPALRTGASEIVSLRPQGSGSTEQHTSLISQFGPKGTASTSRHSDQGARWTWYVRACPEGWGVGLGLPTRSLPCTAGTHHLVELDEDGPPERDSFDRLRIVWAYGALCYENLHPARRTCPPRSLSRPSVTGSSTPCGSMSFVPEREWWRPPLSPSGTTVRFHCLPRSIAEPSRPLPRRRRTDHRTVGAAVVRLGHRRQPAHRRRQRGHRESRLPAGTRRPRAGPRDHRQLAHQRSMGHDRLRARRHQPICSSPTS